MFSGNNTSIFNQPTNQQQQPQQQQNNLFSNLNTNQQNSTGLFSNTGNQQNTNNTSLFGQNQQQSNPNPLNFSFGPQQNQPQLQSQPIITSTKPILTLQSSNSLRYSKIENFNDDIKKMAQKIQLDLINNSMHINYAENLIKRLEENFTVVKNEGINVVKFSKVINTKNTKIKLLLNNIKNEMKKLNESLEKEKSNYRILELGSDMNITIPNDFLLYFTQELEERMMSYSSQIEDIQTLINLYYSEENGSFSVNSDMVEELIIELYKCIKILLSDEAILNDYVNSVKSSFSELLKNYGFSDYQIKARFDSYLDENEK